MPNKAMKPTSKAPRVAILIETSRAFGRGVIEGIAQYVREQGPWHIQFEERGLEDPPPRWLKSWAGDGIIVRTATSAMAAAVRQAGCPIVELLRGRRAGCDIECDHGMVGQMAVDEFLSRGLREFGFFAFGDSIWVRWRREGFLNALASNGFQCRVYRHANSFRRTMPQWDERMRKDVARWIRGLPEPVGVLCATDVHAMRLLEVCRSIGASVPERIAVLGVDNDPVLCNMTNPTLSSVDLDSRRVGYAAAELLSRRMAQKSRVKKCRAGLPFFVPPSHIVTRQSTDVLAVKDADVAQAIRFIRENAHRGLNVSQVAAETLGSRRTLERRFQQALGRSIKSEILRIQVENAKSLLRESSLSIKAIGFQCGFSTFKYFGQAFRRETGVTPRAFRLRSDKSSR